MNNDVKIIVAGSLLTPPFDKTIEQSRRVYLTKALAPTIYTMGGVIRR